MVSSLEETIYGKVAEKEIVGSKSKPKHNENNDTQTHDRRNVLLDNYNRRSDHDPGVLAMNLCTECGFPSPECECGPVDKTVAYDDLPYTTDRFAVPSDLEYAVDRHKRAHSDRIARFMSDRNQADSSDTTNVRLVMAYAVMTVDTDTEQSTDMVDQFQRGDFGADKSAVESTRDGYTKWDKLHTWYSNADNSDTVDMIASELGSGNHERAIIRMAGRDPDTGEESGKRYLRTVKGSLASYMLGDDEALCLDRRVFRAITPLLRRMLTQETRRHPATTDWRMRERSQRQDAVPKSLFKHKTADGLDNDYWCDRMAYNLAEYRAITSKVIGAIASATDAEPGEVPAILFNIGADDGEQYYDQNVMSRLNK